MNYPSRTLLLVFGVVICAVLIVSFGARSVAQQFVHAEIVGFAPNVRLPVVLSDPVTIREVGFFRTTIDPSQTYGEPNHFYRVKTVSAEFVTSPGAAATCALTVDGVPFYFPANDTRNVDISGSKLQASSQCTISVAGTE